ncbi:hypothetical protein VPHD479_0058 [Vibrio phage D479]
MIHMIEPDDNRVQQLFENWATDDVMWKMLSSTPVKSHEMILRVLKNARNNIELGDFYRFIIIEEESDQAIGFATFTPRGATMEVGLSMGSAFWGKGYGSLVIKHAEQFAKELGLAVVFATILPHNTRSQNLFAKNGFHNLGVTERRYVYPGSSIEPCKKVHYYTKLVE